MKYLKIDKGLGYYRVVDEDWISIDKISGNDLLNLLNIALENEFTMDPDDQDSIKNPAHKIIYQNIYTKFEDLLENKTQFKDECDLMFKAAFDKYKVDESK